MLKAALIRNDFRVNGRPTIQADSGNPQEQVIVRRHVEAVTAEVDLFERARKIYSRGRRRYARRASGII